MPSVATWLVPLLPNALTAHATQDMGADLETICTIEYSEKWPSEDMKFSSEEVARYLFRSYLGRGVFGTVFLATDRRTNEDVAIKRMRPEEEMGGDGVPSLILREVALLRALDHPNIVTLKDILAVGLADYYLIFEYVPEDLYRILRGLRKQGRLMPFASVVQFTQQMLNAIHWCHVLMIMHRDLKPQNILLHPTDGLKICDFGLARLFSAVPGSYTRDVVTLWYRSPELLLGSPQYSKEVDLWSGGCIMGEMSSGEPLFPGDSEIGTIFQIMQKRGSPTEASWPGHRATLQHWSDTFPRWQPTDLRCVSHRRPELGQEGMSLLHGLLTMNPASRLRARQAKEHPFLARQAQAALV